MRRAKAAAGGQARANIDNASLIADSAEVVCAAKEVPSHSTERVAVPIDAAARRKKVRRYTLWYGPTQPPATGIWA